MSELGIEKQSEYQISSAILSNSGRNDNTSFDIKNLISSFQIFEHIEKLYLTAEFNIVDNVNLIQGYDFQGGEKLTIDIVQAEERNDGLSIVKEFLIDRIEEITRADEDDAMMQIIVLLLGLAVIFHWKLILFGWLFYHYVGWPF